MARQKAVKEAPTEPTRTGRSLYPKKDRQRPVQVAITTEGLQALNRGTIRRTLSRADYIEMLIRRDAIEAGENIAP